MTNPAHHHRQLRAVTALPTTSTDTWDRLRHSARSGDQEAAQALLARCRRPLHSAVALEARRNNDDATSEVLEAWWRFLPDSESSHGLMSDVLRHTARRRRLRLVVDDSADTTTIVDSADVNDTAIANVEFRELVDAVPPKLRGVALRVANGDSLNAALKAERISPATWYRWCNTQRKVAA